MARINEIFQRYKNQNDVSPPGLQVSDDILMQRAQRAADREDVDAASTKQRKQDLGKAAAEYEGLPYSPDLEPSESEEEDASEPKSLASTISKSPFFPTPNGGPVDESKKYSPPAPAVEKREEAPKGLAAAINGNSTGSGTPSGQYTNPFSKPSDSVFRESLAKYDTQTRKLADNGVDTSDIQASIADAKKAYKDKSDRNDWGEVGQMIAQSIAKGAAALAGGKAGVVGIPTDIPSFDYNKRREQSGKDYDRNISQFEKAASERRMAANEKRQADKDSLAGLREGADFEQKKYLNEAGDYRQGALGAMRGNVDAARFDAQNDRANNRADAAEKARDSRETLKESRDEQAQLQKQSQSIDKALSLLGSPKGTDQEKGAAQAVAAGIPQEEIDSARDAANKGTKNWFSADPSEVVNKLKQSSPTILDIKRRADALKAGRSATIRGEGAPSTQEQQASAPQQDEKIAGYAKQNGLSYDQAEKVLTGRGYKPTR